MPFRFWDEDTTNTSAKLEPPTHPHGRRLLVPYVDHRAKTEPDSAWVATPTNDNDLTKGYTDISYRQFANGANHTVKWLKDNLPASIFAQPFQAFAYVGSKHLCYPFLAVAAGKLELVLVLPSSSVTPEGRERKSSAEAVHDIPALERTGIRSGRSYQPRPNRQSHRVPRAHPLPKGRAPGAGTIHQDLG